MAPLQKGGGRGADSTWSAEALGDLTKCQNAIFKTPASKRQTAILKTRTFGLSKLTMCNANDSMPKRQTAHLPGAPGPPKTPKRTKRSDRKRPKTPKRMVLGYIFSRAAGAAHTRPSPPYIAHSQLTPHSQTQCA